MTQFEDLEVWQKSRAVVRRIYSFTVSGSFARDFSLKDQVRRAAVSIMANIAEGFERNGNKEFIQFLSLAKASCGELRSHLYVAKDQQYLSESEHEEVKAQLMSLSRMIAAFMKHLKFSTLRGSKFSP